MEDQFQSIKISAKDLLCPCCKKQFVRPKLLSCLHTVCQPCIRDLRISQKGVYSFKCPTCQHLTKAVDYADFSGINIPTNAYMMGLVEIHSNRRTTFRGCLVCSMNENRIPASFKCLDCGDTLCRSCSRGHNSSSSTSTHSVVSLDKLRQGCYDLPVLRRQCIHCEKHEAPYRFYCNSCTVLICELCAIADHKLHDHATLEQALEERSARLRQIIPKKHSVKMITDRLGEIEEEENRFKETLVRDVDSLIQKLVKERKTAIRKAKIIFQNERQNLMRLMTDFSLNTVDMYSKVDIIGGNQLLSLCSTLESALESVKENMPSHVDLPPLKKLEANVASFPPGIKIISLKDASEAATNTAGGKPQIKELDSSSGSLKCSPRKTSVETVSEESKESNSASGPCVDCSASGSDKCSVSKTSNSPQTMSLSKSDDRTVAVAKTPQVTVVTNTDKKDGGQADLVKDGKRELPEKSKCENDKPVIATTPVPQEEKNLPSKEEREISGNTDRNINKTIDCDVKKVKVETKSGRDENKTAGCMKAKKEDERSGVNTEVKSSLAVNSTLSGTAAKPETPNKEKFEKERSDRVGNKDTGAINVKRDEPSRTTNEIITNKVVKLVSGTAATTETPTEKKGINIEKKQDESSGEKKVVKEQEGVKTTLSVTAAKTAGTPENMNGVNVKKPDALARGTKDVKYSGAVETTVATTENDNTEDNLKKLSTLNKDVKNSGVVKSTAPKTETANTEVNLKKPTTLTKDVKNSGVVKSTVATTEIGKKEKGAGDSEEKSEDITTKISLISDEERLGSKGSHNRNRNLSLTSRIPHPSFRGLHYKGHYTINLKTDQRIPNISCLEVSLDGTILVLDENNYKAMFYDRSFVYNSCLNKTSDQFIPRMVAFPFGFAAVNDRFLIFCRKDLVVYNATLLGLDPRHTRSKTIPMVCRYKDGVLIGNLPGNEMRYYDVYGNIVNTWTSRVKGPITSLRYAYGDNVIMCSWAFNGAVFVESERDGIVLSILGDFVVGMGDAWHPWDACVTPFGSVIVSDSLRDQIAVYSSTGQIISRTNTGSHGLSEPRCLLLDGQNRLLVSCSKGTIGHYSIYNI